MIHNNINTGWERFKLNVLIWRDWISDKNPTKFKQIAFWYGLNGSGKQTIGYFR